MVAYDSNGIYCHTAVTNNIFVVLSIGSEEHDSLTLYFIPRCHKLSSTKCPGIVEIL